MARREDYQEVPMSRRDSLAHEAQRIDEAHRRLKVEFYARKALREAPRCKRGHPRVPENLIQRRDGSSECRPCKQRREEGRRR